ncbi:NifU family protein [Luteitalea sp. TBR-22]|uniref:NifU family protein n=1 Tax=Luteitalea sp. TBR-22 TaxID=2802971 RepID=UPI001AF4D9BE|nr:NifU family protein [Luteitalea sp. TBR-22]BCS34418.1 NifU family protein [Luteitalea sp. TBR-22]
MPSRTAVEGVLTRVRPYLAADGGDIQLVELAGDEVRIRLVGACADCPTSHMTLHVGIERALRRLDPGLRLVQVA